MGLVIDLFAGGGGASVGIEAALGRKVDVAINHDPTAMAVHLVNHRGTKHFTKGIWEVPPKEATEGRPVDFLWASPDCTHFSVARGGQPKREKAKKSRSLAWVVIRWAREVKPAVIMLENVREFQGWGPLDEGGRLIPWLKGHTFKTWAGTLRGLGYQVEWRVLNAADFGAPTNRKRLFVIARRDGKPIAWPKKTHGPGLLPYRTAAECIDWSIPCPSIFERRKPLAEKTLWRIANGIRRFVLENPEPFIVKVNHGKVEPRAEGIERPLSTVTASQRGHAVVTPFMGRVDMPRANDPLVHHAEEPLRTIHTGGGHAVVTPYIAVMNGIPETGSNPPASVEKPLLTITGQGNRFGVVTPFLATTGHGEREGQGPRVEPVDDPSPTIVGSGLHRALVAPTMVQIDQQGAGPRAVSDPAAPLPTTTTENRHAVAAATLVRQMGESTSADVNAPAPTVMPTAAGKSALAEAFLVRHFGDEWHERHNSLPLFEPAPTITAKDHNSLAAAHLVKLRGDPGDHPGAHPVTEPVPTVSAGGTHVAEVRAFLVKYFGTAKDGKSLFAPMDTLTSKDRLGLVTVEGVDYQIVDIGLRMLEPAELLRAQFGQYAAGYDLSAARTKAAKVRLIGNSVCPDVVRELVAANCRPARAKERAA